MPLPRTEVAPPSHAALARDLARWRERGALRLRGIDLRALPQAALAAGLARTSADACEPPVLTELVRGAIAPVAGSVTGRCALVLLGLDPATFDLAPHLLREDAAEIWGVSLERFRREPQTTVLATVADKILERCHAHRARLERLAMEQRHPADSRLAVSWLERFEAYFRLWTPIYALGADLTAYRATLLDKERPWDQQPGTDGPDYSPELQAAGYGTNALYRLACELSAAQFFIARYGGLWLLSSPEAEVDVRDALSALSRPLPTNERDHSWLRIALEETDGEMHPFLTKLAADAIGRAIHDEWQECLGTCKCTWEEATHDDRAEYFPTARYHSGIGADCRVHQVIEACNRYCSVIEQEWLRVADWYQIGDASGSATPTATHSTLASLAPKTMSSSHSISI